MLVFFNLAIYLSSCYETKTEDSLFNELNDQGPPTFKEALNDAYVFLGKNFKIKLP